MSNNKNELEKLVSQQRPSIAIPDKSKEAEYHDAYAYNYVYNQEAEGKSFPLRNIWRATRMHPWLVTVIPILITLFVTIEVNRPKPLYESSAIVEIKKDTWVMVKSGDSVIEEEADSVLSSPTVKTNTLMLKSRPLLQDVATRLALDREPKFFDITQKKKSYLETIKEIIPLVVAHGKTDDQEPTRLNTASDMKRADADKPTEQSELSDTLSEERKVLLAPYVNVLRDNLNVEPIKDTRALKISFTHTNPMVAATIARGIAESFIERSFQNRTAKFNHATAWLERTTQDLKTKVEKAEQAVADYTRGHNIYTPDAKDSLTTEKLTRLHGEVLRAQTDLMLKASLYEEVKAGRLAQLPEAFADPKTSALQAQLGQLSVRAAQLDVSFGAKNPQVIEVRHEMAAIQEQIDASRKSLEEKLKADYLRAVRDEETLKIALEQAKAEAIEQNQAIIQYDLLKQEADTSRLLYTQFLQKTNQANIQVAEQPSNVRLIEPAEVPSYPVTPNRPLYIGFAFFLSLTTSIGAAFLIEYLSKKIKSVEDVNRYVQLPAIGVVPEIESPSSRHRLARNGDRKQRIPDSSLGLDESNSRPIVSLDHRSLAVEAYRAISTSVLLSSGDRPPKTILFTSGLPGEGKTTTVINTAISLTQLGASVLIIDCDLRNPTSHKVFKVDNTFGLSTYLTDDDSDDALAAEGIDHLICKLQIPNLSLIPAGPIPDNSAKLIISRKMKALLQKLAERYDHVLIDSPPLIGVTDPVILSTLVDGVIVVVHGKKSTREIARRARHELFSVGANIVGVVLNNINYTDYQYYQPGYKYAVSDGESV